MGIFDALFGPNKSRQLHAPFNPREWPYRTHEELHEIERSLELARQGSAEALFSLAASRIASLEWEKAVEWLKKASDVGDKDAMGLLSAMYMKGVGVPLDESQGLYWFDKSGGNISRLIQYPPRQFAKEIVARKKLMEIKVRRQMYDPGDNLTWIFLGAPIGGPLSIQISPSDIERFTEWSAPQFVHEAASPYGGFHEQSAVCLAYFSEASYETAKGKLNQQYSGDGWNK